MTRKLTNQEFLARLSEVTDDVIPLEEYKGYDNKIKITYKSCSHTEYKMPKKILSGQKCGHKDCHNKRISEIRIKNAGKRNVPMLKELGLILLEPYKGNNKKTKVLNQRCNHEYEATVNNMLQGSGCPICHGIKDGLLFRELLNDKYPNQYTVIGEYVNGLTPIEVIHNECGYKWSVKPKYLVKEERCPNCISSKGERYVKRYLESKEIDFEMEYRFDDCRNKNPLPFDFAIFIDGKLGLIEFDGSQHFARHSNHWGSKERYKTTRKHDEIKNNYCFHNNIPLLRIPYWWIRNDRAKREINKFVKKIKQSENKFNYEQLALNL